MRGPEQGDAQTSRYAPLAGAATALIAGGWLAWIAADWAQGGCDCNDALLPAWTWVPMAIGAALCFSTAGLLIARVIRGR